LDLEKAYDTTWRYGILRDLHDMALRGNLPLFVSNFLTERQFKVRLGSTYSNLFDDEDAPSYDDRSTTYDEKAPYYRP
jgi:hypothetical protein